MKYLFTVYFNLSLLMSTSSKIINYLSIYLLTGLNVPRTGDCWDIFVFAYLNKYKN